ncbi:MAG: DUF2240 family protein [Promethearchaeota archaeon]|nr:MAG: DUF2240 family protein [Candidatus Lokiarchaeota archaeon]
MSREDLIKVIIKHTGLSREEINQMIECKKKKLKHLVNDKIALILIAKNLCVDKR